MTEERMTYKNVEAEYMDIVNRNAWPIVYQKIGRECQSYPYTFTEAKKPQNKPLNRYRDVNPYDHSRIVLKNCDGDYINANLVKMERANRRYILTQGPLKSTVSHFWLMIWEQKSKAILMLNKIVEKNEIKCHWYWPHGIGDQHKMTLDDVKLTIEQTSEEDFSYYSTRVFRLMDTETEESREVIQFHYTTWPDFGVPSSPVAFLDFLQKVRFSEALEEDVGPAVVHCSAGIGRSGTFCLVDSCLYIIEKKGAENVNIQEILLEMRKDRMGLIQTPDQLRFSYQAIIEGAKRLDPNWVQSSMEESIYSTVAADERPDADDEDDDDEEEAPPPPPRGASLSRAPARPLPAPPADCPPRPRSSSTEESPQSSPPSPSPSSDQDEASHPLLSPDDTSETSPTADATESVRRRRTRALADRVSAMKRRAQRNEKWQELKRSLYKPIALTFAVIVAGVLVYSYARR